MLLKLAIMVFGIATLTSAIEKRQATIDIVESSPYSDDEICCQASGDPHYLTFDGRRFDFMGEGTYLLAGNCCGDSRIPRLSVYGNNVYRYGLNTVTYMDSVTVYIFGYSVTLGQGRSVQINGRTIPVRRLPFITDSFRVYRFRNNFICVNTVWGLRTCFNGGSLTRVCYPLASRNFRAFDGLCNVTSLTTQIDPPAGDDPVFPDPRDIPIQWPATRTTVPCCDPIDVTQNNYCGLLIDGTGPLRDCIQDRRLNSLNYYRDCQFDACSFSFNSTVAALLAREVVQNYVDMCQIMLNNDITF